MKNREEQLLESNEYLKDIGEEETNFLNKLKSNIREDTNPRFELEDFVHDGSLPMHRDMYSLVGQHVMKGTTTLSAGMTIIAVFNSEKHQWLVNLETPMGKE